MADKQLFTNNAISLLASSISASATSLQVMAGYGNLFPSPGPGEYFLITLEDESATVREIVRVNSRVGDVLGGLVRAQEGTIARAWTSGPGVDTLVDHRVTAETMRLAMELPELSLNGLTDVNTTGAVAGQVLKFNGTDWVPGTDNSGSGGATALDQLTDVDTSTTPPAVGQTLKWNGTNWVPGNDNDTIFTPGSINAFTDVDTATVPPTVGQSLVWNGTNWVPQTISGGSGTAWIYGENTGPTLIDPGWTVPISIATYSADNRTFKFLVTVTMASNGNSESFEVLANVEGNIVANTETVTWVRYGRIGHKFSGQFSIMLVPTMNMLEAVWQNTEAQQVRVMCTRIQHAA